MVPGDIEDDDKLIKVFVRVTKNELEKHYVGLVLNSITFSAFNYSSLQFFLNSFSTKMGFKTNTKNAKRLLNNASDCI